MTRLSFKAGSLGLLLLLGCDVGASRDRAMVDSEAESLAQQATGAQANITTDAGADVAASAAPCVASLPTGFCFRSDVGDYIGGGASVSMTGNVRLTYASSGGVALELSDTRESGAWRAEFAPKQGVASLTAGRYDGAARYPFHDAQHPGLSIAGKGRGCNRLTGSFTVHELEYQPASTLRRFSVTFEQYCEGGAAALRGVINFQARGQADVLPIAAKEIALRGKVTRLTYDASGHAAYGLDPANRRIVKVDLGTGTTTQVSIGAAPADLCIHPTRRSLFAVTKGYALLEHRLDDLAPVRELAWSPADSGRTDTHFHVYCGADRLYLVDAAQDPALFVVDRLDAPFPVVRRAGSLAGPSGSLVGPSSSSISGVGALALNADGSELYYWSQSGWESYGGTSFVRRLDTFDWSTLDQTSASDGMARDPLDAPILLDEAGERILVKNKIFDATNLTRVLYTFPGTADSSRGASENVYALDAARNRAATRNAVYDLTQYRAVVPTLFPNAAQRFFDRDGLLWFLLTADGKLVAQRIP